MLYEHVQLHFVPKAEGFFVVSESLYSDYSFDTRVAELIAAGEAKISHYAKPPFPWLKYILTLVDGSTLEVGLLEGIPPKCEGNAHDPLSYTLIPPKPEPRPEPVPEPQPAPKAETPAFSWDQFQCCCPSPNCYRNEANSVQLLEALLLRR